MEGWKDYPRIGIEIIWLSHMDFNELDINYISVFLQ